jgi:hypothetical protein
VRAPAFEVLRARVASDEAARRAGDEERGRERLVRALRAVGWGGADVADAEDVADMLAPLLDACASGHRSLPALYRDVAEALRQAGPLLDGSLPPAAAYLPAAEEIVARYAADVE